LATIADLKEDVEVEAEAEVETNAIAKDLVYVFN